MKRIKKEKGFTLVEVLTVIVILGIISTIAIVGVQAVMNNGRKKYYKNLKSMIIIAAKDYYSDHKNELPVDIDDKTDPIYVSYLVDQDYLDPVKDAHGKSCDGQIVVYKTGAKTYDYLLTNFTCPDKSMPNLNDENNNTVKDGDIKVVCKTYDKNKKARATLTLNGRSDYRYIIYRQKTDESNYKEVANKKGNIKDGKDSVNIELNYGSGNYKVEVQTGDGATKNTASCTTTVTSPEPDCDGIEYDINHVAKEWFKGELKTTITTDEEKMERYNINSIEISYKDKDNGKTTTTGEKKITKDILKDGLPFTYNKEKDVSKGDLSVIIRNDSGDPKECKLGEYWMDNKPPTCTPNSAKRVNAPQDNKTWTNNANAKVTIDCDDDDNNQENGSGCRQKTFEDSTEDEFANFNKNGANDEIYIEDNVGNTPEDDKNCKNITKLIDRTKPRCSEVSKRSNWTRTNTAFARCKDDLKTGVTPSECTTDTVYQEEADPEGATTTFTIRDNAGNTEQCVAEKKRDHSDPICASKSSHTNWSQTGQAWATCRDAYSGCTQNTYYGNTLDGQYEDIIISDNAGNSTVCANAHKYRDTVQPNCGGTSVRENKTNSQCTANWSEDYQDEDGNNKSVSKSSTTSYTGSCSLTSTASCSDDLSGCSSGSFTSTAGPRYGSGSSSCAGQTCCDNVRSADCSTLNASSVDIYDRAGNKRTCSAYGTGTKGDSSTTVNASCAKVKVTPSKSENTWTNSQVKVNLSWSVSDGYTVTYPGPNGDVTSSSGSMTFVYNRTGDYSNRQYTVRAKTGEPVKCKAPNILIDTIAPTISSFDYNTKQYNNAPFCLNGEANLPASDYNLKFGTFFRLSAYDADSGISHVDYHMAPSFSMNGGSAILSANNINGGSNTHVEVDSGFNGMKNINSSRTYSIDMNLSNAPNGYRNPSTTYCYSYCVMAAVHDRAGNQGDIPSRGNGKCNITESK